MKVAPLRHRWPRKLADVGVSGECELRVSRSLAVCAHGGGEHTLASLAGTSAHAEFRRPLTIRLGLPYYGDRWSSMATHDDLRMAKSVCR
jgi:hypothetical protein